MGTHYRLILLTVAALILFQTGASQAERPRAERKHDGKTAPGGPASDDSITSAGAPQKQGEIPTLTPAIKFMAESKRFNCILKIKGKDGEFREFSTTGEMGKSCAKVEEELKQRKDVKKFVSDTEITEVAGQFGEVFCRQEEFTLGCLFPVNRDRPFEGPEFR